MPGIFYADSLVLSGDSKEDLRVMLGRFAEVCRRRRLKVLNGEEGLECEVHEDGIRLEHIPEFKYFGCVLDEAVTDGAECSRKVASGRRIASAIRSLVNARDLQLEFARFLHEKGIENGGG